LDVLDAQGHDAQSAAIGELEFACYLSAVSAVFGKKEHECMALLDTFDNSRGPVLAGWHIARGDPTINVAPLESRAHTIGNALIFVPIAYEYVSSHTFHPDPQTKSKRRATTGRPVTYSFAV
jgi:hypothetical protein